MKKMLMLALMLVASSALAVEYFYGFEDQGLPLGYYGDMNCTIVMDPVYAGTYALQCEDAAESGTPQAYIAWITGLADGDVVTAGFWRYDDTPGASPSIRIWGHWNDDPNDINGYAGSAGGQDDYGPGTGWDYTEYTWTVSGGHTGLVIEARTYSVAGDTAWIDDIYVNAPLNTCVMLPEGDVATADGSWSELKSLF